MKRIRRLGGPVEMVQPSAEIATGDEIELPDEAADAQLERDPHGWQLVGGRGIVDVDTVKPDA